MGENWAICIGINRYDNLKPLEFAQSDAEAMSHFFADGGRFKRVYLLAEDAPPLPSDFGNPLQSRPSFGNLRRFLRTRFDQPFLQPSDTLWFFFAGHGRRDHDQDYLLPIDADPGDVENTALSVHYIAERLRRSGANDVVLLLDACRNDGARQGQGVGLDRQRGAVTISSCSPSEFSYEIAELGHGAFTQGLLEAFRMQGPQNCATVERLDNFLMSRVPEICRQYGRPRQTPSTFVEPLSKRNLILLPTAALTDDLEPLKIQALEAEAKGELAEAEQLWWRINTVAPGDAQTMEAIRRIAQKPRQMGVNPSPTPAGDERRKTGVSRRVIVAAGGGVAVAVAFGLVAYPSLIKRQGRTSTRSESIPVTRVNAMGAVVSTDAATIQTFRLPIGETAAIDFSLLPAGRFTMGSPPGEPMRIDGTEDQVPIDITAFAMSRVTITQKMWRAVLLSHPGEVNLPLPDNPSSFRSDDDCPVETVSWEQAMEFCARVSNLSGGEIRLPCEAEWEYACRAGTSTPFHFGPTLTPALANYCGAGGAVCGTSFGRNVGGPKYRGVSYTDGAYGEGPTGIFFGSTKPVRSYPPNGFGLFEMHGNVWEHCIDTWSQSLLSLPRDGRAYVGDGDEHTIRGGSFSHNPGICRSSYRDHMRESNRGWEGRVGFRVVYQT